MKRESRSVALAVGLTLIIALAALPLVYFLSSGPVWYICEKWHWPGNSLQAVYHFYQPLERLVGRSVLLSDAYEDYMTYWGFGPFLH